MNRSAAIIRRRLSWWQELLILGVFYLAYSWVRNQFGSAAVAPRQALDNARVIIDIEEAIGLYVEARIQDAFVEATTFIQFWNLFYGLFHFLVTAVVLVWLYFRRSEAFPFWRTSGLIATGSALVGFALFPLMPPRLLGDCGDFGGCIPGQTYVDTVVEIGGIWSFESGAVANVSNQFAAMPSLHVAWAVWSAMAIVALVADRRIRILAVAYPFLTMFAIVVTANHYWIDGVGGAAVVALGWATARKIHPADEPAITSN